MDIKHEVIYTKKDHWCGKCLDLIPAGSKALRVSVLMYKIDARGHEIPTKIPTFYHLGCRPKGLGNIS